MSIKNINSHTCKRSVEGVKSQDTPLPCINAAYLIEEDGYDEVIKGKSLREVSVVKVKEQQGEGENDVLSGELCVGTTDELHSSDRQNQCSSTVCVVCVCVCVWVWVYVCVSTARQIFSEPRAATHKSPNVIL